MEGEHLNERKGSCFDHFNDNTATEKNDYMNKCSNSKTFKIEDVMDIKPCWPREPYRSDIQEADTIPLFEPENERPTLKTYDKVMESLKAFGFMNFRVGQQEATARIVSGLSTLTILSTGSGKSLCYQLPAYMYYKERKSITIVVSPLVALMQDQVAGLPSCLPGACLNSNMTKLQRQRVLKNLKEGNIAVLLVSPESLVSGGFGMGMLPPKSGLPPIAFACIDEAHCLSEWSHNFRPSYLKVCKVLRERYNIRCLLGLTATASQATAKSVIHHLGISSENAIIRDPHPIPENLHITASRDGNRDNALVELLQMKPFTDCDSIIVYVTRRNDTERLAGKLRTCLPDHVPVKTVEEGVKKKVKLIGKARKSKKPFWWNVECYHAGLSPAQRKLVQNQFMNGELRIVVATVAFGMGLDKSDVRSVIHYNMPRSFENYVQEIGRAGRDGKASFCHVFLSEESVDLNEIRRHIYGNSVDRSTVSKFIDLIFPLCGCIELNKKNLSLAGDENRKDRVEDGNPHSLDTYITRKTHIFNEQYDIDDTRQSLSDDEMELLFSQQCDNDVTKECNENLFIMNNEINVDSTNEGNTEVENCTEEAAVESCQDKGNIAHEMEEIVCKERLNSSRDHTIDSKNNFDAELGSGNESISYCSGHRRCLPIDDMIATLDMPQENIATLMAYLELHEKRWVENLNPIRSSCTIKCYGGSDQFQLLAKSFPPVALALKQLSKGELRDLHERRQIDFNMADVADVMCWDVLTIAREVRALQWNMAFAVDAQLNITGKSGIIVEFEDLSFHVLTAEGIDENERDNISDFLYKCVINQEENRLLQLNALYNVLRGLSCEHYWEIKPDIRVDMKAREYISSYFMNDEEGQIVILKEICNESDEMDETPARKWNAISRDIADLIVSHPNENFSGRAIARIFHGIESPKYPAIVFGRDRRFWRQYLDVDFNKLRVFTCKEMLRFK